MYKYNKATYHRIFSYSRKWKICSCILKFIASEQTIQRNTFHDTIVIQ